MDLCSLHVKSINRSPFMHRNSFTEKPISWNFGNVRPSWAGVEDGRDFESGVLNSKRRVSSNGFRSLVVIIHCPKFFLLGYSTIASRSREV